MNKKWFACVLIGLLASAALSAEETMPFGPFGKVTVYRDSPHPKHVVLFVSGDGGWNLGVVGMAKSLADMDALVVGIDIIQYLKNLGHSTRACDYPASDFEELSKFIQQRCGYPDYVAPVLVGYSSGATLVYAILVEAPAATFRGAISLGFCPDLPLTKPFCKGNGLEWRPGPKGKGVLFLPSQTLETPWIALQGLVDQVCFSDSTESFIRRTKNASIVRLPKVGHGYSVERNWMPQFKESFQKIIASASPIPPAPNIEALNDLPLIEVAAKDSSKKYLAVHVTGDGGWGVTDKGLSNALADNGIPVVALNALQYFWKRRTPDEASKDLARILSTFLPAWKKEKAVLIGYSFGADVLPFMVNRLPDEWKSKIRAVVLLGPSHRADFEFHFSGWFGGKGGSNALPILPEIERMKGLNLLCFYGTDDHDTLCPELKPDAAKVIILEGGHRIGKNFDPLVEPILKELQ